MEVTPAEAGRRGELQKPSALSLVEAAKDTIHRWRLVQHLTTNEERAAMFRDVDRWLKEALEQMRDDGK